MKKLLIASLMLGALAGCSQTTKPADEKAVACAKAGLSAEECAKSKYGLHATSLPPVVSPST
ncbi:MULTISPECIES: hypothetical protein [Alphaproteobacteria]|uniref:Lipoprotein n=2 Tax=Alphaproteobacteria TaxID=28211 RepID=A0A512HCF9_9HYPH|nr:MULTISPECIES: hypothetical protein [Alphaproteobacteria]GEO83139.1 hypothetical protein RNA01_00710 [Ciceribacter naphthalenivorans]GLR20466.1 hypothetical protein GCM10007920_02500 [Ciceribacter naphthalenivorans]GLT03322.1 hypothetical protein GCM10007926_02500 [Sphingomonas psychrolutea]